MGVCAGCGFSGEVTVHHIIPQAAGIENRHNTVSLCRKCHDIVDGQGFFTLAELNYLHEHRTSPLSLFVMARVHAESKMAKERHHIVTSLILSVVHQARKLSYRPDDMVALKKLKHCLELLDAQEKRGENDE